MSSMTLAHPSVMLMGQKICKPFVSLCIARGYALLKAHRMHVASHHEHTGKAVDATERAMFPLVEESRQALFLRDGLQLAPALARLEAVDPSSPLVVLDERGVADFSSAVDVTNYWRLGQ